TRTGRAVVIEAHERAVIDTCDGVPAFIEIRRIDDRRAVGGRLELRDTVGKTSVRDRADPVARTRCALCEVQLCTLVVLVAGRHLRVDIERRDLCGGV